MTPNGLTHPAANLFPLLTGDELDELVEDIRRNGLIHPVTLLSDGTLLDGRNRTAACELAGVPIRYDTYHGDDPIGFVVSANVARRHLNAGQRAMLAVELVPLYEAEAAERQAAAARRTNAIRSGELPSDATLGADLPQASKRAPRSRDRAARAASASGRATAQAKRVNQAAPELAAKVKTGELAIDKADRILRERAAAEREAERRAQAAAQTELTFDLRTGDFRTTLNDIPDGTVDLILTDPPYGDDAVRLYAQLAEWAARKLRPGGSLLTYTGQATIPNVTSAMGHHLRYWWTIALTHNAGLQQLPGKWVQVRWKPILWYVRDDRGGNRRYVDDLIHGTGTARKDLHEWAQGEDELLPLIDKLTEPGQLVVDPFAGSGTTGHAANKLGRHFIGSDIPHKQPVLPHKD